MRCSMVAVGNMVEEIIIQNAVFEAEGRRITNHIEISNPRMKAKYFQDTKFYAEYNKDVSVTPLSILNIPALSSLIHFAWAIGCDVKVGEIDETYLNGLRMAARIYKNNPGLAELGTGRKVCGKAFSTKITADKIVNNNGITSDFRESGLLFSGGADSTSSYLARKHTNPKLLMIWGVDIPLDWQNFWMRVVKYYKELNYPILTIKTNSDLIYKSNIRDRLGVKLVEGYRPTFSYSINILGCVAPLTFTERIGKLMISSTYPSREYGDPTMPFTQHCSDFITNQHMRWGDMKTYSVEHEYTTNEKIKHFVKPYLEDHHDFLLLRSCGNLERLAKVKDTQFNCCVCDKCQRVISMLVVNDIDPRRCGFDISSDTYLQMKQDIIGKKWDYNYQIYHWSEIKACIPPVIKTDFLGSKAFMEWLRRWQF